MTSHATTALWTVYNTFCVISWCICYSLYFLSANSCGRSPLKELLNKEDIQLWKKYSFFSSPISHFPFLRSLFLVLPVPMQFTVKYVMGTTNPRYKAHTHTHTHTHKISNPVQKLLRVHVCSDCSQPGEITATMGSRASFLLVHTRQFSLHVHVGTVNNDGTLGIMQQARTKTWMCLSCW